MKTTRSAADKISPWKSVITPERVLIKVLFPAPFSPARTWTSPGRIENETSWSARVAPKDLETWRSSMSGVVGIGTLGWTLGQLVLCGEQLRGAEAGKT